MSETLASFLISVSIIAAIALFVPCIESIAKLVRRERPVQNKLPKKKAAKEYSRETA